MSNPSTEERTETSQNRAEVFEGYTDEEANRIGAKLAEALHLRRSKEYADRWLLDVGYGTKTNAGLLRTIINIIKTT